jgi:K+/H+ antiporter YhaU regulatory subunit KhtT
MVVGIVTADGETLFNLEPGTAIEAGSTLIILGEPADLRRFADDAG